MREDPIVFQDWDVGLLLPELHSRYSTFNLLLSLFIAFIVGGLGIYFRSDFIFLLSVFFAIVSLLAEGLIVRIETSSLARVSFFIMTLVYGVLTIDSLLDVSLPNVKRILVSISIFVVTFLVAIKAMILLIDEQLGRMIGQVLVPKNENSKKKLDEQIKLYENTEFRFATLHETKSTATSFMKYYLRFFVLGFVLMLPLMVAQIVSSEMIYGRDLGALRVLLGVGSSAVVFILVFVPLSFTIMFIIDKVQSFWHDLFERRKSRPNAKISDNTSLRTASETSIRELTR